MSTTREADATVGRLQPTTHVRNRRSFTKGPLLWLLPSMVALLAISLYPQLYSLINSLRFFNLSVSPEPLNFIGFDNYTRAFGDSGFLGAVARTSVFAVVGTALEIGLGILIALVLNQKLRGVQVARTLLIMPTAIAPAVAGLAFRHLYSPEGGLVPHLLGAVGVKVPPEGILGSADTALIGVLATDVWQWTPFVALIVLAGLQGVPGELLEAAQIDGASGVRAFWSVVLPMLKTVIVTVTLLRFISTFNVFDIVYVETRGGPGVSTNVIGLDIFYNGLNYYNIGYASALTWIVTILIAVIINVYLVSAGQKNR
ncbi:carbohydrate ABC transporter permease [Actinopolymorpha pittospori]